MTGYQPISCDLYDWLEIAARWQLPVTITGRDGRTQGQTGSVPSRPEKASNTCLL